MFGKTKNPECFLVFLKPKKKQMKTQNSKIYLEILDCYLSGEGIELDNFHLNRSDIEPMMAFYSRILKPEIYISVSQYIISMLLEN